MCALNLLESNTLANDYVSEIDPAWLAAVLERLDLLLPSMGLRNPKDLHRYALAYIEKYDGNILQLEQENEFLYVALLRAWGASQYDVCKRLAVALAHIVGRLSDPSRAEQILRLGMEASRLCDDEQCYLSLTNRLGILLYSQGKWRQGRRLWHESLQGACSSDMPIVLWEPLSSFTHIANIVGSYSMACLFAEKVWDGGKGEDSEAFATALFVRGFLARVANEPDRAYEDLSYASRLFAQRHSDGRSFASHQLFSMAVQTELARVQGDYPRAKQSAENAYSLARLFADHHSAVDLVIDSVFFSSECGYFSDSRLAFDLRQNMTRGSRNPILSQRGLHLERRLTKYLAQGDSASGWSSSSTLQLPQEALTTREIEVLNLVAHGLSNSEIALRLVVIPATVKKHLEHIYSKIDVHSRTAAVARARDLRILS